MTDPAPVLSARHLSKTFGGEHALKDVSLTVRAGEVRGLLGENGSGKSTLIKILAGYHAPEDGGELEVRGERVPLPLPPGEYRELGLSFVHQDLGLIPSLSVVENLRLGELSTSRRLRIDWREERRRARATLERFGVDIETLTRVQDLGPVERALLAIVRAVDGMPREGGLLVLDEPTVFLPDAERRRLFRLVRQIADAGAAVLFVSHDLGEAAEITDRITVLRDGRNVGTVTTAAASRERLIEMILGRPFSEPETDREAPSPGAAAMSVSGLRDEVVRDVALDLYAGEIVGLTGVAGSGFQELPYLLFDALPDQAALVPADRQRDGAVGSLPLVDNLTLPTLERYARGPFLRRGRMRADTAALLRDFDVRPARPGMEFRALSGGNQQKALLAKWLQTGARVLLLDEPTRGVDVGARQQIIAMIRGVAGEGVAVICSSTDHEQLSELCDRVLVFARGRIRTELRGEELTKDRISAECYGHA